MKMPVGKYRGVLLADLPDDYLEWLHALDDLREPLQSAVDREWRARFEPTGVNPGSLEAEARSMATEIVSSGYRTLAQRHHPDHGGTARGMQLLTSAAEWLRRVVRAAST